MNKLHILALAIAAAATSAGAFADGSDDLLSRNHTLSEMKFAADKLELQAKMAKSYKDMTDAKFIVDAQGRPCLLYTSPSPRDKRQSRMPSSA